MSAKSNTIGQKKQRLEILACGVRDRNLIFPLPKYFILAEVRCLYETSYIAQPVRLRDLDKDNMDVQILDHGWRTFDKELRAIEDDYPYWVDHEVRLEEAEDQAAAAIARNLVGSLQMSLRMRKTRKLTRLQLVTMAVMMVLLLIWAWQLPGTKMVECHEQDIDDTECLIRSSQDAYDMGAHCECRCIVDAGKALCFISASVDSWYCRRINSFCGEARIEVTTDSRSKERRYQR
ncbi:hypothetical protein LTR37_000510 [Vermiconidia calcicola]|uniref:Uncharacterized protein n=1 Tax=Vermiconidia calcicola TaxID=1690605 RepID=A0ACC3NYZ7_9PEZI|nr:hypothetical protein LTR37_000510 [Vermiconidia calcicola]